MLFRSPDASLDRLEQEVGAAVANAKAAGVAWRATSISKRTEIMFNIRNLVAERRNEIAAILTAEHGKVPSDALGEMIKQAMEVPAAKNLPPGIVVRQAGDAEIMGEVFESFATAMGAGIMLVFGVLGYVVKRIGCTVAPLALALVQ